MSACSECGAEILYGIHDYEYAPDVGIDPSEHSVMLKDQLMAECECGVSQVVENMERLHSRIARDLALKDEPLGETEKRFLQRWFYSLHEISEGLTPPTPREDRKT